MLQIVIVVSGIPTGTFFSGMFNPMYVRNFGLEGPKQEDAEKFCEPSVEASLGITVPPDKMAIDRGLLGRLRFPVRLPGGWHG